MRALTWQGNAHVSVETVADPRITEPTDAVIQVTSTAICGSDLHLYTRFGPFLTPGDVLGHETMGVVVDVGAEVEHIAPGDRVVIPFNISCGSCWMCRRGWYAQCETTQVVEHGNGAALFGYTMLYGAVPGGQAEYLRVPQAHFGPIKVPEDVPDERVLYLSDILPTAWQAVEWAEVPDGGTVLVLGLGPIGQLAARIALHRGHRVLGVDRVPERLATARERGVETIDMGETDDVVAAVLDLTEGRGADSVVEAVGMEAAESPVANTAARVIGALPDAIARPVMQHAAVDPMAALSTAFGAVRRAGTISVAGVYTGSADPFPMLRLFDKGVSLRMGQCHVKRWIDDIWPVLMADGDPLGVETFATHRPSLEDAPAAYEMFQKKQDGCLKVVLKP